MQYEILEHPSELRIKVYGKTLEELFSNAVLAMADVLKKDRKRGVETETIKIQSIDLNSLLVDFLSEILARSQINKRVYQVYKFISFKFSDTEAILEAQLFGYPITQFDEDIKAVTYEDLDIKKLDDHWQTMIVFDI